MPSELMQTVADLYLELADEADLPVEDGIDDAGLDWLMGL